MTQSTDANLIARICEAQGIDSDASPDQTIAARTNHVTVFALDATQMSCDASPQMTSISTAIEMTDVLPSLPTSSGGDLRIMSTIAEGGMGIVELAQQHSLARNVAVKRVKRHPPPPEAIASLIQEAQLTGRLEHPNIIPVHALGRDEQNEPLLVMKRVEGQPWRHLIQEHHAQPGGLTERERIRHLEVLIQVTNAVEFAHARDVLHLDIKPENVMLGAYGEVYLLDWGVAVHKNQIALLPEKRIVGTPAYMAPEMAKGVRNATEQTDVYLLGATLHEILTGRPRHDRGSLQAVLMSAVLSLPFDYDPSAPAPLCAIANRACRLNPAERFVNVAAFREAVSEYLLHRGSMQLATQGQARLTELRALIGTLADHTEAKVQSLFTECRFAFELALREWNENADAKAGRSACLLLMIRYELDHFRPDVASVLYDTLGESHPALQTEIQSELQRLNAEQNAREALARIEYANRVRTGDWKKTFWTVFGGIGWGSTVEGLAILSRSGDVTMTQEMNLFFGGGFSIGTIFFFLTLKNVLMPNAIHRRFVLGGSIALTGFVLNRVVSVLLEIPFEHSVVTDFMILFMFMGAAAAFVQQARWWVVGLMAGLIVLSGFFPAYILDIGALLVLILNLHYAWDSRPLDTAKKQTLPTSQAV